MKKKFFVFCSVLLCIFCLFLYRMIDLGIRKHDYYVEELARRTENVILGNSAPRGRILDRNGKVLVDNIGVKTIAYQRVAGISYEDEIEIAYLLANLIDIKGTPSKEEQKKFWMALYPKKAEKLITEEEYQAYRERRCTQTDLYLKKMERITDEMLSVFDLEDLVAAKIYSLMREGYSYDFKVIKDVGVSEEEYASVLESKIPGVIGMLSWERFYPYGDTLRSVFGEVSSKSMGLPYEESAYYLSLGYALNDRVGIRGLEKEYESYLKGEKATYEIGEDGVLKEVSSGSRGNDLVLSIDIDLQLDVEKIVKEEILYAKEHGSNTEYLKEAYVLIGDPRDGSVRAMVGERYTSSRFYDISYESIRSSYTVGSIVKAASMSTAYHNGVISGGEKVVDGCVKLANLPEKCSFRKLGTIDDISALQWSSNYYQFLLAVGLTGKKYTYNMKLGATEEHFSLYRSMFASYGLGVKTGIDLPGELTGLKGTTVADDLLLNFAIGQYDTYTPISLLQYMNTVAMGGVRYPLHLVRTIQKGKNEVIWSYQPEVLNKIEIEEEQMKRISRGLRAVMTSGTGSSYMPQSYMAAGKTGTSESFYDANGDGTSEISTITQTFGMYAPYDDPHVSMVVVAPHASHDNGTSSTRYYLSRKIASKTAKIVFEKYNVS